MKKKIVWSALALMVTIGGLGISFAQQSTIPSSSPTLPEAPVVGKTITGFSGVADDLSRTPRVIYPAVAGWPLAYGAADHSGSGYHEFTDQLLVEYQSASDDAEKNSILAKLTETVGKQFDARQSAREKELKQLEDQLVKLKAAQSKRTAQKDRIVKDRVQQLVNNAEGIGWGVDSPSDGAFQFQAEPVNVEGQLPPLMPRYAPVPDATSPALVSPTSNRP
jgi:hypothetical protein